MYAKHFIPLESDPDIFSELMYRLGVKDDLRFIDIYSLESESLEFVPRPILAVIVIFPDTDPVQSSVPGFDGDREEDGVFWTKQTINNACGFYAILHAVCNGEAKGSLGWPMVSNSIVFPSNSGCQKPDPSWIRSRVPRTRRR
jgi:ubiquitin carboxyl-terminal hydrolase L3